MRKKPDQKVSASTESKGVRAMNSLKYNFENNVPGAIIHGIELAQPYKSCSDKQQRKSAQTINTSTYKPDLNELDTMLKSFKPGLDEDERFDMQKTTAFYKHAYPQSAFNTRL